MLKKLGKFIYKLLPVVLAYWVLAVILCWLGLIYSVMSPITQPALIFYQTTRPSLRITTYQGEMIFQLFCLAVVLFLYYLFLRWLLKKTFLRSAKA